MANGPYLLVLRARDSRRVVELLDESPVSGRRNRVEPRLAKWDAVGGRFCRRAGGASSALRCQGRWPTGSSMKVPMLGVERCELGAKFLSTITIYRYIGGRDRLYRLQFSREELAFSQDRRRHHRG